MQGKWSKAERPLKRALAIWENSHGRDHLDCALALNSLAILFQNQVCAREVLVEKVIGGGRVSYMSVWWY